MERYFSLALILALLLSAVNCAAFAESEDISIEITESTKSEVQLPDVLDPGALDIVDIDLLNDPEADDRVQITGEKDESSDVTCQPNNSDPVLSATSITIGEKEKYTNLKVQMITSNEETPKIKWRSSDKRIAKVDSETGKITGVKKGKATIYAKVEGYKEEIKCKVNVLKSPKARNFSISPKNGSLKVGQIGQYKIDFDHGYGGSFTFSSSDPEIASIDEKGLVTAIAPGTCKIKATMYNDVSHTVSLQVLDSGSSENETIDKLLEYARGKLGCPYDSKHNFGPNSFDCIGFTYWCYKQVGVKLKDSTSKQAEDTRFMSVSYDELAPGDLVYFHTDDDSDVSHAALYLGDGEIIHASQTAGKVIISEMVSSSSDYYKRNFHCARRVFP
jgi:cell wall-associated NlpC family hydrolase